MKLSHLIIASALFLVLPGTLLSQSVTVDETQLSIDFTNTESLSISVKLGEADGINSNMNFAVLDSAGVQIAEFMK